VASNENIGASSFPTSDIILDDQTSEAPKDNVRSLQSEPIQLKSSKPELEDAAALPRSASTIVSQLPSEDIDFLTAADIRATMGTKKSKLPSDPERIAKRQQLDRTFAAANETEQDLDPMIGSQIINDQLIRRKERELREPEHPNGFSVGKGVSRNAVPQQQVESSVDRMKRWLETAGATFAKQFWQDPIEHTDITKSKLFFDKTLHYIRKSRVAMRPIVQDLEKDLPASMALLRRLKKDEEVLELAIHRLRQHSSSDSMQSLSPRRIKAIESIRLKFHQTNDELEKAYAALSELKNTGAVAIASESFKRRLIMASKVLHKNTQLSRMLIYSLQTRLEDPNIDRNVLPNYKTVADSLLSLRDTQMTLMRLIDHAMLVYGVPPQSTAGTTTTDSNNGKPMNEPSSVKDYEGCEEPFIRARLASDAHLLNEIKAHDSSSHGSSYMTEAKDPEPTTKNSREELKPLAHSLFRPFGPIIENLATKETHDLAAEKAREDAERKLGDLNLVAEVKKAYEDTYGAITLDHRQINTEISETSAGEAPIPKRYELLKEDPIGSGVVSVEPLPLTKSIKSTPLSSERDGSQPAQVEACDNIGQQQRHTTDEKASDVSPLVVGNTTPAEFVVSESQAKERRSGLTAVSSVAESSPIVADLDPLTKASASPTIPTLPTKYTVLIHDPRTDNFTISTSTNPPPRDTSPVLPLHQALTTLATPTRFIPHITEGWEIIGAKKHMLVLRDSIDNTTSTRSFETITTPSTQSSLEDATAFKELVNPIDGTARLSPTGYVGPEESPEQLEKEFQERRQAAKAWYRKPKANLDDLANAQLRQQKKRRGTGIVKTAIWAAAVCYVIGVLGEIATSPF
jgi:hypothetical protein